MANMSTPVLPLSPSRSYFFQAVGVTRTLVLVMEKPEKEVQTSDDLYLRLCFRVLALVSTVIGLPTLMLCVGWTLSQAESVVTVASCLLSAPEVASSHNKTVVMVAWILHFFAFRAPQPLVCLCAPVLGYIIVYVNQGANEDVTLWFSQQVRHGFAVVVAFANPLEFIKHQSASILAATCAGMRLEVLVLLVTSHFSRSEHFFWSSVGLALVVASWEYWFSIFGFERFFEIPILVNACLLTFHFLLPKIRCPATYHARNSTFLAVHALCWIHMAHSKVLEQQLSGFPLFWVVLAHLLFVILVVVGFRLVPPPLPAAPESTSQWLAGAASSSATWTFAKVAQYGGRISDSLRRRNSPQVSQALREPDTAPRAPSA